MTTEMATCPVCLGCKRRPVPEETRKYIKYESRWGHWGIAGYDPETDSLPCTNCGGQTMEMKPTGLVPLRPDGTPCAHRYHSETVGNCYHRYTCEYCGDVYHIDSGD